MGRRYNRLKKAANGFTDRDTSVGQNDPRENTARMLADDHGVSEKTVKRADAAAEAIDSNATPELINVLDENRIKLSVAASVTELPPADQILLA